MEDLEIAFREARSFPGLTPPNNAVLKGKREIPNDTVNIYEDQQGNFWYDTESGRKFEQEMQERMKKRGESKKRNRRHGKTA